MIDAKLKGEGLDVDEAEEPTRSNLVDLMAALKKSLGQATEERNPAPAKKGAAAAVTPMKPPPARTFASGALAQNSVICMMRWLRVRDRI